MEYLKKFLILFGSLLVIIPSLSAQDCPGFLGSPDCTMNRQRGYKIYTQSKSVYVALKDTVELNIVFYGQKEYILSFCSVKEFFPVNFRLLDPSSRKIFYDNIEDKYIESLQVGFETTKPVIVQFITIGSQKLSVKNKKPAACVGLLIQYRSKR